MENEAVFCAKICLAIILYCIAFYAVLSEDQEVKSEGPSPDGSPQS